MDEIASITRQRLKCRSGPALRPRGMDEMAIITRNPAWFVRLVRASTESAGRERRVKSSHFVFKGRDEAVVICYMITERR